MVDDDIDNRVEQNVNYHNKSRWYDHVEQAIDNNEPCRQQENAAESLVLGESGTHQFVVNVILVGKEQGGVKA